MYPFYLFLICINGNSVGFNLYDGSRLRSSRNAICLLVSHWVRSTLSATDFEMLFEVLREHPIATDIHLLSFDLKKRDIAHDVYLHPQQWHS